MSLYRYELTSTGHSSHRYGTCEVCGEHVSEIFNQTEYRQYDPRTAPASEEGLADLLEDPALHTGGEPGWTTNGCHDLFGHRACLIAQRKENTCHEHDQLEPSLNPIRP